MFQLTPRTIDDLLIATTDTATLLYTLVDTASSSKGSQSFYGNTTSPGGGVANGVSIRPQDGDIRVIINATPTTTKGFLIKQGTRYFFQGEISKMKLIRVSGAATVATEVVFWSVTPGEVVVGNSDTVGATVAGADTTNDVEKVQVQATYTIPLTASALVKTGAGQLMGYVVNSCGAGATIKIWDNTSAAGSVMFDTQTFTAAVNQGPYQMALPATKFATGCYFTLSGTISVTPLWN